MFLNHIITEDEFFHILTWIVDTNFLIILSSMVLLILAMFVIVRFISLKGELVWKFCLRSLIVL